MQGLCVKEKKMVPIKDPKFDLNKIGRAIAVGTCPNCGTKVTRMLGKDNTPPELAKRVAEFKKPKTGGKSRGSRKSKKSRKSGKKH